MSGRMLESTGRHLVTLVTIERLVQLLLVPDKPQSYSAQYNSRRPPEMRLELSWQLFRCAL